VCMCVYVRVCGWTADRLPVVALTRGMWPLHTTATCARSWVVGGSSTVEAAQPQGDRCLVDITVVVHCLVAQAEWGVLVLMSHTCFQASQPLSSSNGVSAGCGMIMCSGKCSKLCAAAAGFGIGILHHGWRYHGVSRGAERSAASAL